MSKRLCNIHGLWEKSDKQLRCPKCSKQHSNQYDKTKRDKTSKKVYDSKQWREHTRPSVLVRDNYKCVKCGHIGKSSELVVDHIVEIKDGGDKYNKSNLQTLCIKCHAVKTEEEKRKRSKNHTNKNNKDEDHGFRFI